MKTLKSTFDRLFLLLFLVALVTSINSTSAFAQKEKKVREEKAPPDMTLEARVYTITVTEMGNKKAKAKDDQINFKSGKFKSKYFFEEYKFPGGIYTAEADTSPSGAVTITFEAVCKYEKTDLLTWKGEVRGDDIEGTISWTIKDKPKKTLDYEFSGSLKKKRTVGEKK